MRNLKHRDREKNLNDSGMSLVEILIAVSIISVAVVPLLFGFVHIANLSAKGRDVQHTSVLAQTVMENCKAYNVEQIVEQVGFNDFVDGSAASYYDDSQVTVDGSHTFYMTGIQKDNKNYGVSLKLTPYGDSKKEMMQYENMNPVLDAIFLDSETRSTGMGGSEGNDGTQDTVQEFREKANDAFFQWLADKVNAHSGNQVALTVSDTINSMIGDPSSPNANSLHYHRNFYVTAETVSGVDTVTMTVEFFYDIDGKDYEYELPDGTVKKLSGIEQYKYTENYILYSNAGTNTAEHPTALERLYFFIYPNYHQDLLGEYFCCRDEVFIVNKLKDASGNYRELDLYLFKQERPDMSDISIELGEKSYQLKVKGKDKDNNVTPGKVNLYSNIKENIMNPASVVGYKSGHVEHVTMVDQYIKREDEQLMYAVEIKVYENGVYDASTKTMSGDNVIILDGTTVEW